MLLLTIREKSLLLVKTIIVTEAREIYGETERNIWGETEGTIMREKQGNNGENKGKYEINTRK